MDTDEPLRSLLSIYKNKDKVLRHYLPPKTVASVERYELFDDSNDMLYLNDNLSLVSKQTGLIRATGKIVRVREDRVTVRGKYDNLTFPFDESYLFIKHKRKTNKDKRDMFRAILQKLGD